MRSATRAAALLLAASCAQTSVARAEVVTFLGFESDAWQLFAVVDAQRPKRLGKPASDLSGGAISPSGDRVLVVADQRELRIVEVATGATHAIALPDGAYGHPAWMDAKRAVLTRYDFASSSENSDLVSVDLATGATHPLLAQTGNADFATVSPDGRWLVYSLGETVGLRQAAVHVFQRLWRVDLSSGSPVPLIPGFKTAVHPTWSPDGRSLAFAGGDGTPQLWLLNVDGEEPRQITQGAGAKSWPTWSPDASRILFTLTKNGTTSLATVPAAGGAIQAWPPREVKGVSAMRDAHWR